MPDAGSFRRSVKAVAARAFRRNVEPDIVCTRPKVG
jgi:hypothetical protein